MSSPTRRPGSRLIEHLPLVAALTVVLVAATYVNLHKSIWLDETFTLDRTGVSLQETLDYARHRSLKPPLYFVLVYYWRKLSPSIEFTRLLSTVCIMLAVVFFHRLSKLLNIWSGWLGLGLLAALTPHFLWAAAEARPYALTVLCLTAAIYYFCRLWVTGTERPARATIWFVLAAYGALLTFYYSGFVLAALFLAGLLARRDLRRLVWCGVALAVLLLPWAPYISEATASQEGSYLAEVDAVSGAASWALTASALWLARQFTDVIFRATPFLNRPWAEPLFWGLIGTVAAARVLSGRPRWSQSDTVFAVFALGSFGALATLRLANVTTVDDRHWIIVVPGLLLLPSLLASQIQPAWRARAAGLSLLAFFSVAALSYARNERGPADWKSASAAVARAERPGEPIIVFVSSSEPFLYYYHGPNAVQRVPAAYSPTPRDTSTVLSRSDLLHLLRHLSGSTEGTFWLVERHWARTGPDVLRAQLGPLEILEKKDFHRIRVFHLRLLGPGLQQ